MRFTMTTVTSPYVTSHEKIGFVKEIDHHKDKTNSETKIIFI